MAVEGTLDLFQLPEIMQVVSQQRKTGILTIQGSRDIVAVSFLEGRIVAADSLTETTEQGLGEVLTSRGNVDSEILRRLASRASAGDGRLADLLVEEGHVERGELLDALRTHTMNLLRSLLSWNRGEFKFYGGDEVSYEEGFRPIGVDELLLHALEEAEEDERRNLPEPDSLLRRLPDGPPIEVRDPGLGEVGEPASEGAVVVTREEERILSEVSQERSVADVAMAAGISLDRARYALYRLAQEGLIEPAGRAPGPAPEPASPASPVSTDAPFRAGVPEASPSIGLRPEESRPVERAPPEPAPAIAPRPRPPARRPHPPEPGPAAVGLPISGLLAAILAGLVVLLLLLGPTRILLPFPWLDAERGSFETTRDGALLLGIDRAARTHFLLRGRFPDRLQELEELGLLRSGHTIDARGRALGYSAGEASYEIHPLVADGGSGEGGMRESITGDFLLDPEYLGSVRERAAAEPPLVLLD